LRATDVLDLLPNFLLRYLQADPDGNAVVVTGPRWMAERVAADIAKLDVPLRQVDFEVALVEYTSGNAGRALRSTVLGNCAFRFDSHRRPAVPLAPGVGRSCPRYLRTESAGQPAPPRCGC
jgi:hypothetical protein